MAKDFWADEPVAEQSPAEDGGAFWLSEPVEGQRDLPEGVTPSTAGAGRGSSPASAYNPPAPAPRERASWEDDADQLMAATAAPAAKKTSVLEGIDLQPGKPWSFSEASQNRRRLDDTPIPQGRSYADSVPEGTDIGMDIAETVKNPAARGLVAGVTGLGKVLPGAVRAAADFVGADGVADFAGRAAKTGDQITTPLQPKGGNEKLVFDIANSITQTAPTMMAGLVGGPAMKVLFAQSAAQEYTDGRSAGLDGASAAGRAGIMAGAEVIGERFGFSEQMQIFKSLAKRIPADQLAPVFARQIMKEIPGEQLTTLIQFLGDKAGPGALNPEATLTDYLSQAGETLKVTIGQTAVMGGGPTVINKVREGLAKPIDRTPQIERLRNEGDELAAAHLERKQNQEQAAYSAEKEAGALADFGPGLQGAYKAIRATGAKTGESVSKASLQWHFEQAAELAGLSPKAQQAISDKLAEVPPEKAAAFVQKAVTGLVNNGMAQPFEGIDTLAQTIEQQRDRMMDSVLSVMDDIETMEGQQDGTQDTADATAGQTTDGAGTSGTEGTQRTEQGLGGVESVAQDGQSELQAALDQNNDVQVTPEMDAVHQAATSPLNDLPEPTQAQKEAGNYKVGKIRMSGMDISIENPQGSERRGVDQDGKEWKTPLKDHYGYFKGTLAADGDKLDVFIKPGTPQDFDGTAYVVDQIDPKTGEFDEHKIVFGAADQAEAEAIYKRNYSADWQGLGSITPLPMPAFKAWAKSGATKKPLGTLPNVQNPQAPAAGSQAQAAPVEAPANRAGDAAAASGVPAAPGSGDVQANGLKIGTTPKNAEAVTVKNGVVHIGKYEAVNYDTGEPVTVPAGASDAQIKQALKDGGALSRNQKVYGGAQDAEPQAEPAPAAKAEKPAPKPVTDRARSFRIASHKKNPLWAFLGKHGMSLDLAKEFAPGKTERQKAIVSGYGPIFKRTGLGIDMLAEQAKAEGFIATEDVAELHDLISRAFNGERIIPQYAEGVADTEMEAKQKAMEDASQADYEDFLAVQKDDPDADIPFSSDELAEAGYDGLTDDQQKQLSALLQAAEAEGIDVQEIQAEAESYFLGKKDNEYKQRIEANIEAARNSRAPVASGTGTDAAGSEAGREGVGSGREAVGQEGAPGAVSAEEKIRAAFRALKSVSIGSWYPITVKHNGTTQNFLAAQKKLANGRSDPAIHLLNIKAGKMLASDAERQNIANFYKLDGNNSLNSQGLPSVASDEQVSEWEKAGFSGLVEPKSQTLEARPDGTLSVTGDSAALKERLTAAGIPAKSIVKSARGVVVGKTQAKKAREVLERKAINPETAGNMKSGDVVVDGKGVEYIALRARFDFIEVAPIVNGKANVSADTTFYFHLRPDTASAYDNRRNDPVYATGKNLYEDKGETLTAPTKSDIEAQQARTEQADAIDQREQVKRESEQGDSSFMTGFSGDGRQDTTGGLFDAPTESEIAPVEREIEVDRKALIDLENKIVGAAGMAPGFIEDAMKSRKVPKALKDERNALREKMREKIAGGLPIFQRPLTADLFRQMNNRQQSGMAVTDVQKAIATVTGKWSNGPKITVVATTKDLPMNAPSDVHGVYVNGSVYLVAANITDAKAAKTVLAHEAIAHHGLRELLGKDDWKALMNNITLAVKTGNKPLNAIKAEVRKAYVDDAGKFNLTPGQEADEIAAKVVEQAIDADGQFRPGFGFVKSVYAKIAEFLRSIGIDLKFTHAELQGLLVNAQRNLEIGKRTEGARGRTEPVFSREDQTQTEAFKKWFGDSKVVDADGKPLVVYHGTNSEFTEFDTETQSGGALGQGFYFAEDRTVSEESGSKVMPVNLSIKKPLVLSSLSGKDRDTWNDLFENDPAAAKERAIDEGFDGILDDVYTDRNWVAFNPTQIKSATGNNGDFDGTNPDIRFSRSAKITAPIEAEKAVGSSGRSARVVPVDDPLGALQTAITEVFVDGGNPYAYLIADAFGRSPLSPKAGDFLASFGNFLVLENVQPPVNEGFGDGLVRNAKMLTDLAGAPSFVEKGYSFLDAPTKRKVLLSVGALIHNREILDAVVKLVPVDVMNILRSKKTPTKASLNDQTVLPGGPSIVSDDAITVLIDKAALAAMDPKTIKAAKELSGAGLGNLGGVPDNRLPTNGTGKNGGHGQMRLFGVPNVWNDPEPTRLDSIIYELQDKTIDLKRVQEAIASTGAKIAEKFDARLAETLYPGRVATKAQKFLDTEAKPLLDAMARNNVTMDELGDYLHARHAPERNKQIASINPDLPDGGAGKNSKGELMTTAAARAYIAGLSDSKRMVLTAMARRVDAITKGTTDLLVSEGLEKQETIDAWNGAYENYVPLHRDEAESGTTHPTGSGMSVRGSASKRATGSTKQATNILAHVLMQREAAITRAEKNRVAVALYGMAMSNPNPDFWTTIRPSMKPEAIGQELQRMGVDPTVAEAGMRGVPTIKSVDPTIGRVVSRPNPIYKSMPGAIVLKVNGEDRVLMLNVNDPRGLRLAENLKNLDGLTKLDIAGSVVGKATRWMASVNTQYNPAFGLVNLTRDTLGGAINLTSTKLRGKTLKVLAMTPAALKGIGLELSGKKSGEWGRLFRQFQNDGGQTGYREQFKDANDRAKALQSELKALEDAGKLTSQKVAGKILDGLDIFNTTLENAVRLAAYKEALDVGMSRAEAARLGRELTVDFNRKGRMGRELGPLYAFFNASVQGSARTLQTLAGPDGAKIIAGGVGLGVMQAVMLLAAGYDDDEIPEFVKARAFIIPLGSDDKGEKKYFAIPLPLGLHVLPNTGRVLAELTLDGGKDALAKGFDAVGEIAGAFNPLGGGNIFTTDGALRTLAPTIIDPLIELGANKNFAGTAIERESFSETDQRPGFERARESTLRKATGQAYMEVSRIINTLSGGDEYQAGRVSPTPEMLRYLAQVVGGGLLREIEKIINTTVDLSEGKEVKSSGVPVFGRFYGETDDESVQRSRYYDNLRAIEKAEKLVKSAEKKGDFEAADRFEQKYPESMLSKEKNRAAKDLRELNRDAMETVDDNEAIKMLDGERTEIMRELNSYAEEIDKPRRDGTMGEALRKALGK